MFATFRHFFSSAQVLKAYMGKPGSEMEMCQKIRAGIQLSLRGQCHCTPDHMHRHKIEHFLPQKESLANILLKALGVLPCEALKYPIMQVHDDKVYIHQDFFELWQNEIVTYQSPTPYIAAAWLAHANEHDFSLQNVANKTIHSLAHSSLPSIYEKRLHRLFHDSQTHKGNLCDLHMHFNGSSEFTNIWLHALEHKLAVGKCLEDAGKDEKAHYFYEQLGITPQKVFNNLHKACVIRQYICAALHTWNHCSHDSISNAEEDNQDDINLLTNATLDDLLHTEQRHVSCQQGHPFKHADHHHTTPLTPLQQEGLMWVYILYALQERKNYTFAKLVHVYLLLMHQYLRLLVHQQEQYGFEQFQYITCIKAYDPLEDNNVIQRFVQLHGMYGPDMAHVELRFSPKATADKNRVFFQRILDGYEHCYIDKSSKVIPCVSCPKIVENYRIQNGLPLPVHTHKPNTAFDFSLVVHFIKEKDIENGSYRHSKLRASLLEKAQALIAAIKVAPPHLAQRVVGKDAAANELEAAPEVFAPIFRMLYDEGITCSTYHAGEDFEHILSGIRAVHEAVTFLNLGSGDRIGHATALGIAPSKTSHLQIFCKRGHWLDNLIWLTRQIYTHPLKEHHGLLFGLQTKIQKLYKDIYKKPCPELVILWKAWELRTLDISIKNTIFASERHTLLEKKKLDQARQEHPEAYNEWLQYHMLSKYKESWNEDIAINEDFLSQELIHAVQDSVINEMRHKNIIVEVLPSSNVRISHYKSTVEHHVLRWLDSQDVRPVPQVVLGTDDPGIFATNLRNEYVLLFNILQKKYSAESEKPYQIIQHLIENSHSYKFSSS